jgi:sugar O-acyltransferase (sialic acid O-acetyltransferase NeuD family)
MSRSKSLVIVGAGGFGRETLDVVRAIDPTGATWSFIGFVAGDAPDTDLLHRIDATWLGNDEEFLRLPSATHYVVAIGDPALRRELSQRYDDAGLKPVTLVHPSSLIGSDVQIGEGSIICSHTSITTNIRIGRHVHVDRTTTVGHDSVIEDYVTLHPSSVISGSVHIGLGTRVGTNACVLPGVAVGRHVMVGAGAVVTSDVPDSITVKGVPARPSVP